MRATQGFSSSTRFWIAIAPRGLKFRVQLTEGEARGYVAENYGLPFRLPELGPIGANGLANARDFLAPVAAFISGNLQLRGNLQPEIDRTRL